MAFFIPQLTSVILEEGAILLIKGLLPGTRTLCFFFFFFNPPSLFLRVPTPKQYFLASEPPGRARNENAHSWVHPQTYES